MFSLHGKTALITLAFLAIAGIGLMRPFEGGPAVGDAVLLTVTHSAPLSLALSLTEGAAGSLVDIDQTSGETIALDAPRAWKRTEVRRSPLSSVTSEQGEGDATRWTLPANAGISFSSESPVGTVTVRNPSGATLKIRLTRVNLAKQTSTYDVYLLKEGSLTLP